MPEILLKLSFDKYACVSRDGVRIVHGAHVCLTAEELEKVIEAFAKIKNPQPRAQREAIA